MEDKQIRFTDKKVDESWKEQASRDREKAVILQQGSKPQTEAKTLSAKVPNTTSPAFLSLLKSLGYQVMIQLGEIPHPASGRSEPDLESARESIEMLVALKTKTAGNTSPEELEIFENVLPELQMKFAAKA